MVVERRWVFVGNGGGSRIRAPATSATSLGPIHQAFSVSLPAFAFAATCLAGSLNVSALAFIVQRAGHGARTHTCRHCYKYLSCGKSTHHCGCKCMPCLCLIVLPKSFGRAILDLLLFCTRAEYQVLFHWFCRLLCRHVTAWRLSACPSVRLFHQRVPLHLSF